MSLPHHLQSLRLVYRTLITRDRPVIIYSPGRVGSMSTLAAVRQTGRLGFKVEGFDAETLHSVAFVKRHIIDTGRPSDIISLIRDPIEILISLYFSKLKHLPPVDRTSIESLHAHFITNMLETTTYHDHYLRWFETEFAPHLGFSVFKYPFDTERKYTTISHNRFPTLVMRLDLANKEKSQLLSDFLGTEATVSTSNVKTKDPLYNQFKNSIAIPAGLVNNVYNLPYSQHFFSAAERAEMIERWTSKST